jgi:hypothetical protein
VAVQAAVDFLRDNLAIDLPAGDDARCVFSKRNAQCARVQCVLYGSASC